MLYILFLKISDFIGFAASINQYLRDIMDTITICGDCGAGVTQ